MPPPSLQAVSLQLTGWQYPAGVTLSMRVLRCSALSSCDGIHGVQVCQAGPRLSLATSCSLSCTSALPCCASPSCSTLVFSSCRRSAVGALAKPLCYSYFLRCSSCASNCILHVCCRLSFCFCSPCSTDHLLTLCPSSHHAFCAGGQRWRVP